jgi:hypothetical protein
MTKLTANQAEAMQVLAQYEGQTISVFTSQYIHNVNPDFRAKACGYYKSPTLRGLAAKGLIRIEKAYWKGATITVLQAA